MRVGWAGIHVSSEKAREEECKRSVRIKKDIVPFF